MSTELEFEVMMKKLRRELLITRIFTMILTVIMLVVLAGGFLVCKTVQGYVQEAEPMLEQLSELDIISFNDTVTGLNETLNSVDWEQVSAQLGELDVEALNEAIAGLDTEELSTTLKNVNEAAENLRKLSDGLKSFGSMFGQ